MAIVHVEYKAPVTAVVNTETGEVERVVVDDESTVRDPDGDDLPQWENADIYDNLTPDETEALIAKAVKIAEDGDRGWPAWRFGW